MSDCIFTAKEFAAQEKFREKLQALLNEYSFEDGSNTPDYVLSTYLTDCIQAFNRATLRRDSHYGGCPKPIVTDIASDGNPEHLKGCIISGDLPRGFGG